ncbi:MAG: hypothetical protein QGI88_12410 [SAR202 cluster bacterium]|nr:hypothetical protein [SAR202 cluster bacterium]
MGIFSAIFGHNKPVAPEREKFFSIIGAAFELQGNSDFRLREKAGLVMNPAESQYFDNLNSELHNLLSVSERSTGTRFEIADDDYGTRWAVLDDQDFEDLVTTVHMIAETVADHGYGNRLLASVFAVEFSRRDAYIIYNYKSGNFYPFATAGNHERDNALELRLGEALKAMNVPVERRLENWYALWGIPF